jgi:hypothetical protein
MCMWPLMNWRHVGASHTRLTSALTNMIQHGPHRPGSNRGTTTDSQTLNKGHTTMR